MAKKKRSMRSLTRELDNLYNNLKAPDLQYQAYKPETLGPSGYSSIIEDPRLKGAQMGVLSDLQSQISQGGLSAIDRANIAQIQSETNRQERANRESILQNAAQRGVGGSGLELASQLQNQQGSAQRASDMGMQVAAQAEQARLQALGQVADLGTTVRGQEYEQSANKAAAEDLINRFNVESRNNAFLRNADEQNRLAQMQYENQMNRIGGRMGAINSSLTQRAAQRQRVAGNIFGGLEAAGTLLGQGVTAAGAIKGMMVKKEK